MKESTQLSPMNSYEAILMLDNLTLAEKINHIKTGFTKSQLSSLRDIIELDWTTLAQLLTVNVRTLHNKTEEEILGLNVSDRMMAIVEIYSLGYNLFGDKNLFDDWIRCENAAFGENTPIQIMETIIGIEEVRNEIQRLKYGAY